MLRRGFLTAAMVSRRLIHRRATKTSKPQPPPLPPPPSPPKPPQKPTPVSLHGETLQDPYAWMSSLSDTVAMRHMDLHMEQEEKYTEAVLASLGADRLVRKLQIEMAPRLASDLSTPPVRWGPWLYYRRVEEGKQYPVLCRRKASLHEEFISYSDPSAGFDFTSGKKIEQKINDYNQEAERFGGYSYEELSEVSPDHNFIAYTMYDKDKDSFTLLVRDLTTGLLLNRPRTDRVAALSWAMNGRALLYTVVNDDKRPYRIYCSMLGSTKDDTIILEEIDENIYLSIRNTKDFSFITVNIFSDSSSKVYLIRGDDPLSGMKLVWEGETQSHCVIEHNRGKFFLFTDSARDTHCLLFSDANSSSTNDWQNLLDEEPGTTLLDVDFCDSHMVLILKQENKFRLCSVKLPLPSNIKGPVRLSDLYPCNLALPDHVCQITSGPNYDFFSSVMRFTISSPVMPDAVVDYNLSNGKWATVQQQNLLYERTKILYGTSFASTTKENQTIDNNNSIRDISDGNNVWNDLLDYYECQYYYADSKDGEISIPLTVVYSKKHKVEGGPGLLHGHGAYGEVMDRRWRSELKSLLDRGWVIAFADVRGGGSHGKKWHQDGTRTEKINSINDFVSCAEFLVEKGLVEENRLAAWGYSAGGLLVASAINSKPGLFRTAILKVPFLDVLNTLLHPILPLTPIDYHEFGYPMFEEDFLAIKKYSPYENIQKDVLYPAVMITSSLSTRFGVWEAAKWAARARDLTVYDPQRPIVLNMTADIVEDSKYLQTKELAIETAFLLKTVT
ncbi:prolyl endopeptidase-like protein [Carex littledalei]|uniref:Prolyl endopeptidase n=1 Tax=Carex littledalei TaxID=544730 RepID=A0A833QQW2_9POAL|nr:prolyl endopeptidase-like protein [Carex littledalei]